MESLVDAAGSATLFVVVVISLPESMATPFVAPLSTADSTPGAAAVVPTAVAAVVVVVVSVVVAAVAVAAMFELESDAG